MPEAEKPLLVIGAAGERHLVSCQDRQHFLLHDDRLHHFDDGVFIRREPLFPGEPSLPQSGCSQLSSDEDFLG